MSKRPLVPKAKQELDRFKMEVANELGIPNNEQLSNAYLGNISTKEAGQMGGTRYTGNVGGEMVKRMVAQAEHELARREGRK